MATIDIANLAIASTGSPDLPVQVYVANFAISHPATSQLPATLAISNVSVFHPPSHQSPTVAAGGDQDSVEPGATVTLTGTVTDPDSVVVSSGWEIVDATNGVNFANIQFSGTGNAQTFEAPANLDGTILTCQFFVIDTWGQKISDTLRVGVMWSVETLMTDTGLVPLLPALVMQ